VVFDDDFDNGNLTSVHCDGGVYTVAPLSWLHFRITGAAGQTLHFRLHQGENAIYKPGHRMVYRYEGSEDWLYFDHGDLEEYDGTYYHWYYFHNDAPFTGDVVYVAYWYPWTFSQMQSYMQQISTE